MNFLNADIYIVGNLTIHLPSKGREHSACFDVKLKFPSICANDLAFATSYKKFVRILKRLLLTFE